jgi:hypothetical protein
VPRRILAAALAALGILVLTPERLSGEPAAPSATTLFGDLVPGPPNPLTIYPGRPNARYEDIEADPRRPIELGTANLRLLGWSIQPAGSLPRSSVPAKLSTYEQLGLADGYEPVSTSTTGDVLRATVRMQRPPTSFLTGTTACAATAADGTVIVPYDRLPPEPVAVTSSTSSAPPEDIDFYLPIGTIRGRLYLTCRVSLLGAPYGQDRRAVWGIDV